MFFLLLTGLRPPSPGFLPAPNQPNQGSKSPTPNSHFPAPPAPPSRNLSRSPQPPINQPHPSQEVTQMAPIQGGAPKSQQQQGGRNGAWEMSWEPKRPGMPAPPVTPRDGRGGGLPAPGPLLPQAPPPQGGLLPERGNNGGGKLSPRGPSPQPMQNPRGGHGQAPIHHQVSC